MERIIRCPRILVFLDQEMIDRDRLELPGEFIKNYGKDIPRDVHLQLPNGFQIDVRYKKDEESLCKLDGLLRFSKRGRYCIVIVLRYKGSGIFFTNFLNSGRSEIKYGKADIVRGHVFHQDTEGGIGWKFYSLGIGPIMSKGKTDVPASFLKKFRKKLPKDLTVSLKNGEQFACKLSKNEGHVYINGLRPLVDKKYLQLWDIVMFTYFGNGKFELCIFDRQKLERTYPDESNESESETASETDTDSDSEGDSEEYANMNVDEAVGIEEEPHNIERHFVATMSASNTNSTSHGVYIPKSIHPFGRDWALGEEVTLRTQNGEWTVGLVHSGFLPRFSSGWNRFVRQNKIAIHNRLIFNLVEDDGARIVFGIQIEHGA